MKKQLGQLLIDKKLITSDQLEKALAFQKEKGGLLGQILIELKMIGEQDLVMALADQYGFPYMPLENYEVNTEAIKILPEHVARQYFLVPIDKIGNVLTVGMADPLNDFAIRDIEYLTGCKVTPFVSTASDIKRALDKFYGKSQQSEETDVSKLNFGNAPRQVEEKNKEDKQQKNDREG
jgi:type IV pilus assembly protein PilB